jgi:hypothetical protein
LKRSFNAVTFTIDVVSLTISGQVWQREWTAPGTLMNKELPRSIGLASEHRPTQQNRGAIGFGQIVRPKTEKASVKRKKTRTKLTGTFTGSFHCPL